jgi:hypothetical protein
VLGFGLLITALVSRLIASLVSVLLEVRLDFVLEPAARTLADFDGLRQPALTPAAVNAVAPET